MFKTILKSQGALLIEVLLAIMILSVVLTVVMNSFVSSLRATVTTADYSTALSLLDDKMFDVQLQKALETQASSESFPEPYDRFSYDFESKDFGVDSPTKTIQEIDLSVSWTQGKRNNRVNLATLQFIPPKK